MEARIALLEQRVDDIERVLDNQTNNGHVNQPVEAAGAAAHVAAQHNLNDPMRRNRNKRKTRKNRNTRKH